MSTCDKGPGSHLVIRAFAISQPGWLFATKAPVKIELSAARGVLMGNVTDVENTSDDSS